MKAFKGTPMKEKMGVASDRISIWLLLRRTLHRLEILLGFLNHEDTKTQSNTKKQTADKELNHFVPPHALVPSWFFSKT